MEKMKDGVKKKYFSRKLVVILVIIIAIAGIICSVFFYNKYQSIKNNPTELVKQETKKLVEDIGRLVDLPTGEDPTVATVTDSTKLADQTFFKYAQNGDKLLAYTIAKKAILYRPSTNKIINIAPFSISPNATESN